MSQTAYTFNVRSLSHPGVLRTMELRGDQSLADLHGMIEEEFDLDPDHLWAFYLSGEWHDRDSEFDQSGRAHDARLETLGLEPGLRIAHVHDFGDEWRHVADVVRVGEVQPELEYPRIVDRVGGVVPRSKWGREEEEDEFGERFSPDLIATIEGAIAAYRAERSEARAQPLQRSAAAIDAALGACPTKLRLEQLGRSVDCPFTVWIPDVARELAGAGSSPRAVALLGRLARTLGYEPFSAKLLGLAIECASAWDETEYEADIVLPTSRLAALIHTLSAASLTPRRVEELSILVGRSLSLFLSRAVDQLSTAKEFGAAREAAVWLSNADGNPGEMVNVAYHLAGAKRSDEARALLAEAEALPCAPSAFEAYSIARGYATIGDDAAAEKRLRQLAGRRWITIQDRDAVVGLLAELLERTGRAPEGSAVEAEHAAWHRRRLELRAGTVRRTEPRVGRNDPCPCGSGKKFKKCCG